MLLISLVFSYGYKYFYVQKNNYFLKASSQS